MKRILLKLSGEALAGDKHHGFDEPTVTVVAKQVKQIVDGNWKCENYYGGMADGLVDIAPLNKDLCTEDMQKAVDEAKAKLEDGSFNVFDGVIETNDGKTVGEEGKTLDDATITGGINWYFKNVEVK